MNRRYTQTEETANAVSHGIGIILGIISGWFLLQKASLNPDQYAVLYVAIYLSGLLSSYITSTWYHAARPGKTKEKLRKFDHAAIYLHIAGTYTPFTLLILIHAGFWGWGIFTFVWISAVLGIIMSFTNLQEHSNLETICFVVMGAAILVALKPLMNCLSAMDALPAFWWLVAGGISYIAGAVFYSFRKEYMHSVFHLFCLGGTVCHLTAVWLIL